MSLPQCAITHVITKRFARVYVSLDPHLDFHYLLILVL